MNCPLNFNKLYRFIFILFLIPLITSAQYTDVINSNRPGLSVSAYAVGKNVVQAEMGVFYEQRDHMLLNTQSDIWGTNISLRYGLLFERLELNYEGTFENQNLTYSNIDLTANRTNFSRNRLGLKFLVYDPFKSEEANKPNLYSWRANNKFQLKNLLPAVSLYGGANFVLEDNPFYVGEPTISYRGMLATQSKLTPRAVLITNTAYDRITTDFPELSFMVSISHAFRNPKWSAFTEYQQIISDRYADQLIRGGIAHLIRENWQLDFSMGASLKNTPSRIFIGIGGSYRLDMHKDKLIPIEEQKADENGGGIEKNAMKNKKKKKQKNSGSGAEDIDLGPTKKQLKKLKKSEKKKKKKKKEEDSEFEF